MSVDREPDRQPLSGSASESKPTSTTPSQDAGSLANLLDAVARTPDVAAVLQTPPDLGQKFSILRKLGAGAFGAVYEAFDHQREQIVALKVLNYLQPSSLYRFKHEFRALSRVRDQHLVQLYELHEHEGHWFFSMELVAGVSLAEVFAAQRRKSSPRALPPASVSELRALFTQLCHGVQTLHREGMLHRDLKPSNVQITHDGRVKLLDFGMVLETRGTREDGLVGTPLYMAPEQALATSEELTPACDWYAVGVMLYEALVGRPPFAHITRSMALLHAKQAREPPAPSQLVDGVPPELDRLCVALLRRDPAVRPSARIILQALSGESFAGEASVDGDRWRRNDSSSVFIGRQPQLAFLRRALDDVRTRPVVCFVSGVSGVGKSALIERFVDSLDSEGVLVLRGASYAQESVPYKAWDAVVDLLSQYLSRLPKAAQSRFTPKHCAALRCIFPVLGRVKVIEQAADPPDDIDARELRRRAFGAFRELMSRLAEEHQLIVHLEDLQWSDIDSVELLLSLLRDDDKIPRMLVLGSFRSDERESSPALQYLLEKAAAFSARLLPLPPLSPEEATSLASQLSGLATSAERLEAIARESGGIPIFLTELSHAAVFEDLPGAVDFVQLVHRRVSRLSPDTLRLLHAFAAAGEPILPKLAAMAVGLQVSHDDISELLSQHLLRLRSTTAGQQAEIYHARIGDSLMRGLSETAKVTLHAGLARTLEQDESVDPERLAGHFFAAGEREQGWRLIRRAADEAVRTLAFARAIRLFRKLLDESGPEQQQERRSLQCSLASALANSGRYDEAVRYFDAGLPREQSVPRGQLEIGVAVLRHLPPLVFRLLVQSERRHPTGEQIALLSLRYEKTVSLIYVDPLRMFLESLALQKDLARYPVRSTPRGFEIWSFVSGVLAFSGLSFALARRILARCSALLDPTADSEVLFCRLSELVLEFSVGRWAAIPTFDGALLRRNLEAGRFWHVSSYVLYSALLHIGRGEIAAAERLIEQLQEIAERHDFRHVAGAYAHFLRATLIVRARRADDAETTLTAGLEFHREIGMEGPQILFHSARVLARLFDGNSAELAAAGEAMTAADELVSRQAPAPPHYVAVYWIARVRLAQAQLERAMEVGDRRAAARWRRIAGRDLAAAVRNARRYAFVGAETLTLQGRQCWLCGKRRRATRWWRAAIAEARRLGAPLDEGRARFELGSALLEIHGRSGPHRAEPEAQLELARRLFEDLGASWDLAHLHNWRDTHG